MPKQLLTKYDDISSSNLQNVNLINQIKSELVFAEQNQDLKRKT